MKKVAPQNPNNIKNYEIETEIGRGASGICYRAKSKTDGNVYAIKKILLNCLKKTNLKQAMDEVNILKNLSHPNIIKYHDSFIDENNLYIVMEYASKGDLHSIIKRRRIKQQFFSEKELWQMAKQLLQALQYLHRKNIIHRDFKTLNIFMDQKDNLLVGDLGVSKIIKADLGLYSRVGTPLYLAPQIIKYQKYDFKADMWGLGCVMYILSALIHPFQGKNIINLGQNIVYSEPKPIKNVSSQLNEFVHKMLEKNPNNRPLSKELLTQYFDKKEEPKNEEKETKQIIKYQSEKVNRISKQVEPQIIFHQNYRKVRNNFVEDKKHNIPEQFSIKSKGLGDITKEKNAESTIIRKPAQDRGIRIYFSHNEQTPSKYKEKIKTPHQNNDVPEKQINLETSLQAQKRSKNIQKFCTQMQGEKEDDGDVLNKKRRTIQSAKPKISSNNDISKIEDGKKFTVSGNIHKLMHDSSQIIKDKLKGHQRPKSSLNKGKFFGHRQLKYIKKLPNQHIEIEGLQTKTQVIKKPGVILI